MPIRVTEVEVPCGDDVIRAWLLRPEHAEGSAPCIVMGHGFGLTRRCGLRSFADPFVEAGYAALVFDYRGFGDSEGRPRQVVSFRRQLEDWSATLAFARAQPEIDAQRVIAWGFSLGAGHALMAAKRDPRVGAVVAVAPMFDGLSSTLAAARRWSLSTFLRIAGRAIRDLIAALLHESPVTVPIAAPPGELGLLTTEDAYPGYRAMAPNDFDFNIAARVALFFWSYIPGRRLRRFDRPILVMPSVLDEINPPKPTLRRVGRCVTATVVELTCPHMKITVDPHRSQVVESTLEFLRAHVPTRNRTATSARPRLDVSPRRDERG